MTHSYANGCFIFSAAALEKIAGDLSGAYKDAQPWPHTVIDDFLPEVVAEDILDNFPAPDHEIWLERDRTHQPRKLGIGNASRLESLAPFMHHILFVFQSYPFVNFIEKLTGIDKLLPDPHLHGCLQQTLNGGHLSIHADFNKLDRVDLYRRVNAILYLNKDWKPEYNGELELWDKESGRCVTSVAPIFNRLIVFNTDKSSPHGHPKPLNTPPDVTRKSIAFFYYTTAPVEGERFDRVTDWVETRP